MKLWQKKYQFDKKVEAFTVGDDYLIDQKIVKYDCIASMAHAKMLAKCGLLTMQEANSLSKELKRIILLDKKNKFVIQQEDEDCHTAIENHLVRNLGVLGKKIHTARSRNDQVLAALRLYYKDELTLILQYIEDLIKVIQRFDSKYGKTKIPGFTHMRKAMPSSINLWANSFIDSMLDNKKIIKAIIDLIDQSPLGSAAGYGVPIKIDKEYTAKLLGFKSVQKNPIYVQNSRGKFESSILHSLSQVMFDINKISTDLILFSMSEFSFFELPLDFCSGSSIMPNKKNPDVLELMRAKYHVIIANELQIKSTMSNLISGYNRDLQLNKKIMIESLDISNQCLFMMIELFKKIEVNEFYCSEAMTDEIYATEKVYKMVEKGVPFREAYKIIGKNF